MNGEDAAGGGNQSPGSKMEDEGGCSCSTAAARSRADALAMIVLLGLLSLRFGRRSR
jgi:MYXO-CTERM domain-containing protein